MPVTSPKSPWIVRHPRPEARLRMFCFPHAGSGAGIYRLWAEGLPSVEVCAFQPPGRETRIQETLETRMEPLVSAYLQEVVARDDLPFAFYGHSLGSFFAFEVTRALRRRGGPMPRHLFVASAVAPQIHTVTAPVHQGPDTGLVARLRRYGGTPEAVLAEPELMALLLPIFRADLTLFETYRAAEEPPLDIPISAFGGHGDELAHRAAIEGWRAQTSRAFALRELPGGHLFLQTERAGLLSAILADLGPHLRP